MPQTDPRPATHDITRTRFRTALARVVTAFFSVARRNARPGSPVDLSSYAFSDDVERRMQSALCDGRQLPWRPDR